MSKDLIETFLQATVESHGSDLHLRSGKVPHVRINGFLAPFESTPPMSANELEKILDHLEVGGRLQKEFNERKQVDFAIHVPAGRFRVNVFQEDSGIAAVFRSLPSEIPTLSSLNLPEQVTRFANLPQGLVLVTGATGSGKSTTLAAMVDHINEARACHILALEDPIEFIHQQKKALISQREIGRHTLSFADALKSALREDPNVILIGEMRDQESISRAIEAADTGHLVLATVHTNDAASTVDRLVGTFPPVEQNRIQTTLAASLRGILSQRLFPRAAGSGRVAALEILVNTLAIANLIRDGKYKQIPGTMETSRSAGMVTMAQSIETLINNGSVLEHDVPEALRPK
jgi:twitching motility protein PilT